MEEQESSATSKCSSSHRQALHGQVIEETEKPSRTEPNDLAAAAAEAQQHTPRSFSQASWTQKSKASRIHHSSIYVMRPVVYDTDSNPPHRQVVTNDVLHLLNMSDMGHTYPPTHGGPQRQARMAERRARALSTCATMYYRGRRMSQ